MTTRPKPSPKSKLNNSSNLKTVNDPLLTKQLTEIIESNQVNLSGEYELYTVYQKENGETYALIYAFYLEKDGIAYENMKKIAEKDARHIHELIAGLSLDYLFVVPYYDYEDREKGSIMIGAIVTNE